MRANIPWAPAPLRRIIFFGLWCAFAAAALPAPLYALLPEEINTIAAYDKAAPSVVNITTAVCEQEFFFCAVPTETGSGSGVVLKEDGTIVTNYHVISGARRIEAALADGRRLEAKVVASSPDEDLAIIRVSVGDRPLKAVTLGDSDKLEVGEKVLAIGNPFGLGQTLTTGIVSMTGRNIRDGGKVLRNLIQIDAPVNPGNSGGALVDSNGDLVGLNTAILSPTGANIGIGFALPVNRLKEVVPGLMQPWKKALGWILAIALVYWFFRRIYRH